MTCQGGCGICCGHGGEVLLTPGEVSILERLAEIPFLPVARQADAEQPIYLEDQDYAASEYGALFLGLNRKGLISLDFDLPLKNFDYAAYGAYPIHGSVALTARGQSVVELLDRFGSGE